jgi:hypothetical protein
MTSAPQRPMRIGELLITVGLLTDQDLDEAAQVAVDLGLPLGKVLVMSGYLSDAQLQAAVQIQSMLKDQVLTTDLASSALALVKAKDIPIEAALREVGWVQKDVQSTNKLGELLQEAGVVTAQQLREALDQTRESGLPLGRICLPERTNIAARRKNHPRSGRQRAGRRLLPPNEHRAGLDGPRRLSSPCP